VDEPRIGDAVRQIIEGRRKQGWTSSPDSMATFRVALRQNLELRSKWWDDLRKSGHVELARYPVGSRWKSASSPSVLERTATGYHLVGNSLGSLDFDEAGRLTGIRDTKGKTAIAYDEKGRIASLRAPNGVEFRFSLNSSGFVQRIDARGKDGKTYAATYVFDDRNDLREMVDQAGDKSRYAYDDAHNLTRIDYMDGTSRLISYDPSSYFTTKSTNRDGSWTEYEYYGTTDVYGTRLVQRDSVTVKRRAHYEWEIRTAEDGRRYTWRILTDENGTLTETFYDDAGRRTKVRQKTAAGETITLYDKDGRVIRK
jgi:YD repeat-containing protein